MTTVNFQTVLGSAARDMRVLGDCKQMLVSPGMLASMRGRLQINAMFLYMTDKKETPEIEGQIYFRGVPVVLCSQLENIQYAFVK